MSAKKNGIKSSRGRLLVELVPIKVQVPPHAVKVKGWLNKNDKFFESVDEIVAERARRRPRPVDF